MTLISTSKNTKRRILAVFVGIALIFLVKNIKPEATKNHVIRGETMGTTFSIILSHTLLTPIELKTIKEDINYILNNINNSMSDYIKDSEVTKFNNFRDVNLSRKISDDFYEVVSAALLIYQETNGFFDITVSPLVNLWGFGPDSVKGPPNEMDIKSVMAAIGSDKISIGKENEIRKKHPDLKINLNAIAKGFAVDKLSEYLLGKRIKNFMVEIGGEIVCRGKNRKGNPWAIGIDSPDSSLQPGEIIHSVVEPGDKAMATSGDYRRYIKKGNTRYSHIIDPTTGHPANHTLASVSVIANTCMEADAYATALFVMGMDKGLKWANRKDGIEAYFINRNTDGSFTAKETNGFWVGLRGE